MKQNRKFSRQILTTATAILFVTTLAVPAVAFDGRRPGIAVGGGIGFSPIAHASLNGVSPESQNVSGLAANARLGYCWNEHSMLILIYNAVFYESDFAAYAGGTVSQGFEGIGWLQHLGDGPTTLYLAGGIGLQHFTSYTRDFESHDPGFAVLIAAGLEPRRHFQLEVSFSLGKTSVSTVDYNHSQLMVTANAIAF